MRRRGGCSGEAIPWSATRLRLLLALAFASSVAGSEAALGDWQLPLPSATPGDVWEGADESTLNATVCNASWSTASIRPRSDYTTPLKERQLRGTYASFAIFFGPVDTQYEEDHLIPLELGGHPRSERNLWPQPRGSPLFGHQAEKKDVLENALRKRVCAGAVGLREAQRAVAEDWPAAYRRFVLAEGGPGGEQAVHMESWQRYTGREEAEEPRNRRKTTLLASVMFVAAAAAVWLAGSLIVRHRRSMREYELGRALLAGEA